MLLAIKHLHHSEVVTRIQDCQTKHMDMGIGYYNGVWLSCFDTCTKYHHVTCDDLRARDQYDSLLNIEFKPFDGHCNTLIAQVRHCKVSTSTTLGHC